MCRFDLDYLQYKLWLVLYALRINICPYTRERDILGPVEPLLVNTAIGLDNLFLATVEERPSIHPQFAVLVTVEESTFDLLVRELVAAELYSVQCDTVRLGPNHLDQPTPMHIPNRFPAAKHANPDAVIQILREECSWYKQESLARILYFQHVSVVTVIDALLAWFYPNEED